MEYNSMKTSEFREVARSRWNELYPDQRREIRAYVICSAIKHIRREIHKGGNRIRRAISPEETLQSGVGRIKAEVGHSKRVQTSQEESELADDEIARSCTLFFVALCHPLVVHFFDDVR